MSTACLIAMPLGDGKYRSIYCHFDGYDRDQGADPTLRTHYNSEEQARSLIDLGDLSYINADVACAYHRDRGEPWSGIQPRVSDSEAELMDLASQRWVRYLYIFEDGAWQTRKG
jgi:hypothetical protein